MTNYILLIVTYLNLTGFYTSWLSIAGIVGAFVALYGLLEYHV
jgi:hypothetical protein